MEDQTTPGAPAPGTQEAPPADRPDVVVKIAGEPFRVEPFMGFKLLEATAIVSEIMDTAPKVQARLADYMNDYRAKNVERLPRAEVEGRYPNLAKNVSAEAWEASGGIMTLTGTPSQFELVTALFPVAFREARERVVDLLSVVVCPNALLEEYDQQGRSLYPARDEAGAIADAGALADYRRQVLHKTPPRELARLLVAVADELRDEFENMGGAVGELAALFGMGLAADEPTPVEAGQETPSGAQTSSDSGAESSPDGGAETSSTEPPGANSQLSEVG